MFLLVSLSTVSGFSTSSRHLFALSLQLLRTCKFSNRLEQSTIDSNIIFAHLCVLAGWLQEKTFPQIAGLELLRRLSNTAQNTSHFAERWPLSINTLQQANDRHPQQLAISDESDVVVGFRRACSSVTSHTRRSFGILYRSLFVLRECSFFRRSFS